MASAQELQEMYDNMPEDQRAAASEPKPDTRGRVTNATAVRMLRNKEQWERYDSVVIGVGASSQSKGWFDTFQGLARVSQISWFQSRDSNVDTCWTNQKSERYDYAQDLYQLMVEFLCPTYMAEFSQDGAAAKYAQLLWTQELPKALGMEALLADADIIAQAPATAFPAGRGNIGMFATDTGASVLNGGNNGVATRENSWLWPDPVMIAAVAKLTVRAYIGQPINNVLREMPGPGISKIPKGDGTYIDVPNWFAIRCTFRGPRYMQLRGARSAS